MVSLNFLKKKRELSLEDKIQAIQAGDSHILHDLIESYKPFVAKTVSSVCKRYIDESDDEYSIGLIAFNDAIQKYNRDKGISLISFAETIIRNRVIDYIRKQARYQQSTVFIDHIDEDDHQNNQSKIEADLSIENYQLKIEETSRREEIFQYTHSLAEYGLTFHELVKQSPKHADARKNAISIAQIIANNEEMLQYLQDKKRLPIKVLETHVNVSRKTIERNRKYIIAMTLLFIHDYVYLKDYLKGVLENE